MGSIDRNFKCKTCGLYQDKCPGHFGYLKLKLPVFYIQYVTKKKYVQRILNMICIRCSKLLCEKEDFVYLLKEDNRMKYVHAKCKKINICGKCIEDGCGAPQPKRYELKDLKMCAVWDLQKFGSMEGVGKNGTQELSTIYVLDLFKNITDDDLKYFGLSPQFSRPEWMICSVLPIPPPCIRPSIKNKNQRSEDDLTHVLLEIIKVNNSIGTKTEQKIIDLQHNTLQYYIATYMDNNIQSIPKNEGKRSTRAIKSITERIKGKDGRIRGNIMGKRVDFSARTVITPDDGLEIDELGVPEKIAKNMTYPETVTKYNINKLNILLKNGYSIYPGIKSIHKILNDKIYKTISLKYCSILDQITLEIGDIVNRSLIDGDIVLFNRQPSLHKMSMMAHRVKVLEDESFHLNVSVTSPYNADFDGDEMNMHVPQSIQTSHEINSLSNVRTQIISPSKTSPIIALVQDSLLGIYLLTKNDFVLVKRDIMKLLFKFVQKKS